MSQEKSTDSNLTEQLIHKKKSEIFTLFLLQITTSATLSILPRELLFVVISMNYPEYFPDLALEYWSEVEFSNYIRTDYVELSHNDFTHLWPACLKYRNISQLKFFQRELANRMNVYDNLMKTKSHLHPPGGHDYKKLTHKQGKCIYSYLVSDKAHQRSNHGPFKIDDLLLLFDIVMSGDSFTNNNDSINLLYLQILSRDFWIQVLDHPLWPHPAWDTSLDETKLVFVTKYFLEHGLNVNFQKNQELIFLKLIISKYKSNELLNLFLDNNVDLEYKDKDGKMPLEYANAYNKDDFAELILNRMQA